MGALTELNTINNKKHKGRQRVEHSRSMVATIGNGIKETLRVVLDVDRQDEPDVRAWQKAVDLHGTVQVFGLQKGKESVDPFSITESTRKCILGRGGIFNVVQYGMIRGMSLAGSGLVLSPHTHNPHYTIEMDCVLIGIAPTPDPRCLPPPYLKIYQAQGPGPKWDLCQKLALGANRVGSAAPSAKRPRSRTELRPDPLNIRITKL